MGYSWNGVCYPDADGALKAFSNDIPSGDAAGINTFAALPSISGSGLITWAISNRPLSDTAATTRTGTTQLPPCAEDMSQFPIQSLAVYIAFAFAVLLGFRTGYRP